MTNVLKFDEDKIPYIEVGGPDNIIRLEKEELVGEWKEKSYRELRETPELVESSLTELRQLLQEEKTLYVPLDDDEFLIKFLRPCKFYTKSAFERMRKFYKFKIKHKKVCEDLLPTNSRFVFEQNLVHLQPRRDQNGSRILIIECGKKWKPSKCPLDDLFRSVQITLEAAMVEPLTHVNGVIVIFDMDGLSFSHVLQFTPSFAKMVLDWVQECIAVRLKAVHIINNSYLFNMIFNIFKPFMTEKLRKRIHFHNKDWNSLTSFVTKEALRPRYGGTMDLPEVDGAMLADLLQLYNKDFDMANTFGYTKDIK